MFWCHVEASKMSLRNNPLIVNTKVINSASYKYYSYFLMEVTYGWQNQVMTNYVLWNSGLGEEIQLFLSSECLGEKGASAQIENSLPISQVLTCGIYGELHA